MLSSIEQEILTAHKNLNIENKDTSCGHFSIYQQDKFHARVENEKFYNLNACLI